MPAFKKQTSRNIVLYGGSDQFKTVNEEFYGDSKHQRLMDEEL